MPQVFTTPRGIRTLGRDTAATVEHWSAIVKSMPVAPRIFRDAGRPVPRKSPDILRFHYSAFMDQRQKGYCVGFNSAGTVMTRLRIPDGATATAGDPLAEVALSPLYMYDVSRMEAKAEGWDLGSGDGSIGSCAARGSMKSGVCTWDLDPADASSVDLHRNDTVPDQVSRGFGSSHLVKAIALADSWEHGLELNAAGLPLAICSDIPESMLDTDADGNFRMIGPVAGGHCYQLIDHDRDADVAVIGQCWARWGRETSDPAFSARGGYTQVGTCPLSELAGWFGPAAMSSGASEMIAYNTVEGFDAPAILSYAAWE